MSPKSKRTRAALAALVVAAGTLGTAGAAPAGRPDGQQHQQRRPGLFERTATCPVFQNRPAGEDAAAGTVAEISAVSDDGRTLVHTDAVARRIGFLDITGPDRPRGLGTLSLEQLGDAEDEPTSVTVVGQYVMVVVNTSAGYARPSGRLDVVSLRDRERVASFDLGGQPDSIALSKDKRYAAIAIENERDEETTPPGRDKGDLPQAPAGFDGSAKWPAWCYGAPGVSRALQLAGRALGRADFSDLARASVDRLLVLPRSAWGIDDHALCHGWAGALHLLGRLDEAWQDPRLAELRDAIAAELVSAFDPALPFGLRFTMTKVPFGSDVSGYLDGAAGVALALDSYATAGTPADWDMPLMLA
ncbi:lanthionine synthetase LanC family protein [Streptomyces sp. NPDC058847]|uniref:lanthionine synthetase LanC family protein n=1 Tax=Streptomyces sp. NPDC058847 TaxID=3346649 RepID=UPI0036CC032D